MPLTLRLDPWASEYEGALHIQEEERPEPSVSVDPFVETSHWRVIEPSYQGRPGAIFFIDGVRRVDVGAIDEGEGRLTYGLFGSVAAGAVACRPDGAQIELREIGRRLILGGGIKYKTVEVPAGTAVLQYKGHAAPENSRNAVLQELQNLMRSLEGELARQVGRGEALTLVDGPLTFLLPLEEAILGYVKRHFRRYLQEPEHVTVIHELEVGCRTPVFQFGEGSASRYSWYLRLAPRRAMEYGLAGVVRLEVSASVGQEEASRLADETASFLPPFATTPIWDVRAPQNLYPLSALEADLHHHLGDHRWVRRAIETHLLAEGGGA